MRKSVELDQADWARMKDYTWVARETDRSLDSHGSVKSEKTEKWETVVLYGEPHHRMLERDGKPLSAGDQQQGTTETGQGRGEAAAGKPRNKENAARPHMRSSARKTANSCAMCPTCSISKCWAMKRSTAVTYG